MIVDSEPLWERADRIIVGMEGKSYQTETKNNIMGLNPIDSVKELCRIHKISTAPEILLCRRENLMTEFYEKTVDLTNGAYEILEYLYDKGIKIALASSTPKRFFIKTLTKYKIDKFFKVIVTSEDVSKAKPDPEIFIKTSKLLDVPKKEIIIVEDSHAGVSAAISAGMTVLWLNKVHLQFSCKYIKKVVDITKPAG